MSFLKLDNPILIASDHGGLELKQKVLETFVQLKFKDLGPSTSESVNYPDYAHSLSSRISEVDSPANENPRAMGVLICGSGQGMAITANKYKNIRAALCWNESSAELSRSHNNAQILCLGARLLQQDLAFKIINKFFSTPFEGGRHLARIQKI